MIDREKVINGLEVCVDRVPGKYDCNKCPYEIDGNYCEINMAKDVLTLLKEQETHEKELPVRQYVGEYFGAVSICPSCEASWIMSDDDDLHFCPHCGQKVKFEHN